MTIANPAMQETVLTVGEIDDWSEELALVRAQEIGIGMTEAHWEVIHYLRAQCDKSDRPCNARKMIRDLQAHFRAEGGKRYLYRLFPGGPVCQASHIAGMPMPSETLDISFGTVH